MSQPDPLADERMALEAFENIRTVIREHAARYQMSHYSGDVVLVGLSRIEDYVSRLQIRLVDQEHALISARTARGETQERYSRNLAEHHAFMNDMLDALDLTIDEDGEYILDQIVTAARATRAELAEQRERGDGLRRDLLAFIITGVTEIGSFNDEAWWWHDRIAEALSEILEKYPLAGDAATGPAKE